MSELASHRGWRNSSVTRLDGRAWLSTAIDLQSLECSLLTRLACTAHGPQDTVPGETPGPASGEACLVPD